MPIHKKLVGKLRINAEDLDLIVSYSWYLHNVGYANAHINGTGKKVLLHRLIASRVFGDIDNFQVDHIDRNPLNNVRNNLRLVTSQQNKFNASIRSDNLSGYRGVSWSIKYSKWCAFIQIDRRVKNLGLFVDKIDAVRAYNKAVVELFGEFANLNKVD